MPLGKTHDKMSYLICIAASITLYTYHLRLDFLVLFSIGWLVATLFFSPDLDIMPKKRSFLLAPFLYPYSLIFKHRGVSHSIFLGTLTRVIYGILVSLFIIYILFEMGKIEHSPETAWEGLIFYLKNFDIGRDEYRYLVWPFLGAWLSDLVHIALDRLF